MAFSDLCHITNAYQTVENETDQAENIMDDSFVRDLICNLLEEGPSSESSSIPPENTLNIPPSQYPGNDAGTSLLPPYNFPANPPPFNFSPNENGFNYMPGFPNGFGSFPENDVNTLLGVDLPDTTETVSPEQLNLLRLAAQEIGGAQFQSPNNNYNFFEPNQRNSLPENINLFPNYNRPTSLNIDQNYNNFDAFNQRIPNNFKDPSEILSYLTQLNMNLDRNREENGINGIDFNKMPDLNGYHQNEMNEHKMNQIFNGPFPPNRSEFFEMMGQNVRPQMNFDFPNFKHGVNGFPQEFMRREMNQMPNFPEQNGFDNREMQQMALMRQQELARQMSIFMRNRPPPNQLNVDVSYLHDPNHFNMGYGALVGQSPSHPPPVLPSPGVDIPLLAPFYAMRNIRNAATSSGVLHARLDACYEQWRQLERERKRTEARLALAYPGRAVSSSNSIPVPRLPPCPTRVDRLTVDMLREHTKVLTLMGKMETLRASVCAQQKRTKPDENKITVLKRGQENVPGKDKELDPNAFNPTSWREDVKNLSEIAPHKEVELAMLSWRNAVASVQAARKREMHPVSHAPRNNINDPILQLAEAVKHLSQSARRARCAMWCDLTLTVALAPNNQPYDHSQTESTPSSAQTTPVKQATPEKAASNTATASKPTASEAKEVKPTTEATTNAVTAATSIATGTTSNAIGTTSNAAGTISYTAGTTSNAIGTTSNAAGTTSNAIGTTSNAIGTTSNATGTTSNATATGAKPAKPTEKEKRDRRQQNYKKHLQRNDFFRNQRYDARFMGRHPYHYLATGQLG